MNNNLHPDILERLRVASHLDASSWQKLLNVSWIDYSMIRSGELPLSEESLLTISDFFSYRPIPDKNDPKPSRT